MMVTRISLTKAKVNFCGEIAHAQVWLNDLFDTNGKVGIGSENEKVKKAMKY